MIGRTTRPDMGDKIPMSITPPEGNYSFNTCVSYNPSSRFGTSVHPGEKDLLVTLWKPGNVSPSGVSITTLSDIGVEKLRKLYARRESVDMCSQWKVPRRTHEQLVSDPSESYNWGSRDTGMWSASFGRREEGRLCVRIGHLWVKKRVPL